MFGAGKFIDPAKWLEKFSAWGIPTGFVPVARAQELAGPVGRPAKGEVGPSVDLGHCRADKTPRKIETYDTRRSAKGSGGQCGHYLSMAEVDAKELFAPECFRRKDASGGPAHVDAGSAERT